MISCSHWGMFRYEPRVIMIPSGYKMSRAQIAEWQKPGSIVIIESADVTE